ncbi:FecR family protein [Mucilaginibacter lacusdianchii]|uniref:FecR family protein n=1 Tax=Mucilaginibacter lacusdianchii TaxID=2684211 RepID=UPI00131C2005|nr:FecR domain-containing protein [Mucilaginibacter sp. JXJ CY 39]
MERDQLKSIIERYTEGKATPEENDLVEDWLLLHEMSANRLGSNKAVSEENLVQEIYEAISKQVKPKEANVRELRISKLLQAMAVAAVLLIFIGLLWQRETISGLFSPGPDMLIYHANKSMTMHLADGSKVILEKGAELRYPRKFNGSKREIFLEGQAYFDVVHDKKLPFIVHTGTILTHVLGTAFNIDANMEQHLVTVTVTRGKVSVSSGDEVLEVLTPNQQALVHTDNDQHLKTSVSSSAVIAWTNTKLKFDDLTFAAAVKQLEQHFNVKIAFENKALETCRFTGTVEQDERLEDILGVLCAFNHSTFRKLTDDTFLISGKGCN